MKEIYLRKQKVYKFNNFYIIEMFPSDLRVTRRFFFGGIYGR